MNFRLHTLSAVVLCLLLSQSEHVEGWGGRLPIGVIPFLPMPYRINEATRKLTDIFGGYTPLLLPHIGKIMSDGRSHHGRQIKCKLAMSYGTLTSASMKTMDRNLKIVLGHTIRDMARASTLSWSSITKRMKDNKMLDPQHGSEICKSTHKSYGGRANISNGHRDKNLERRVISWLKGYIGDTNILADLQLHVNDIGELMSATGARVNSFGSIFKRHIRMTKKFLDIGVLRMPDISNPKFEIYQVKLEAFNDITRIMMIETKHTGFRVEVHKRMYKPRMDVAARLSSQATDQALKEMKALINEL